MIWISLFFLDHHHQPLDAISFTLFRGIGADLSLHITRKKILSYIWHESHVHFCLGHVCGGLESLVPCLGGWCSWWVATRDEMRVCTRRSPGSTRSGAGHARAMPRPALGARVDATWCALGATNRARPTAPIDWLTDGAPVARAVSGGRCRGLPAPILTSTRLRMLYIN